MLLESISRHSRRVLPNALLAGLPVRLHHVVPADVLIRQEAVRRHRLAPVLACIGDARPGLVGQSLGQQHRPAVESRIAQIQGLELFRCPAHTRTPVMTKPSSYEICITGWANAWCQKPPFCDIKRDELFRTTLMW